MSQSEGRQLARITDNLHIAPKQSRDRISKLPAVLSDAVKSSLTHSKSLSEQGLLGRTSGVDKTITSISPFHWGAIFRKIEMQSRRVAECVLGGGCQGPRQCIYELLDMGWTENQGWAHFQNIAVLSLHADQHPQLAHLIDHQSRLRRSRF